MAKKNLIPIMTSNITPEGECKANSVWMSGREAFRAFDNKTETMWTNNPRNTAWISYTFTKETVANEIMFIHNNEGAIYWSKAELYGDGNLLCTILKEDGIQSDDKKFTVFNKRFENKNSYREYKISFNTTDYTYILEIELYNSASYQFLLKQNNQYYTIKPEFYSNGQFQSLTLEGGTTPNENDYENFGFEDLNDLLIPQNSKAINGVDKGVLGEGKYFEIELDNEVKKIIDIK